MHWRDERGSVLIMAVIAMLILGVLSVSFALLASIETKMGVNYSQQTQAEALAEAGLEVGRSMLAGAGSGPGFTPWFDGTNATHMLVTNQALVPGTYSVRVDNDCSTVNTVPSQIQEGGASPTICNNSVDTNERAVVTSWAQVGTGRSRVRAMMYVDDPWKHVCSDAAPDHGGYCNDTQNTKGNPTVNPANPNQEGGPKAWDDLPRPLIGCSRVAPAVHGMTPLDCAALPAPRIFSQPAAGGYPAFPAEKKLVVMGEDPAVTTGAQVCNTSGAVSYFGYFDCALTTPCPAAICGGTIRKACVLPTDPRAPGGAAEDLLNYVAVDTMTGACPIEGGVTQTGMVFTSTVAAEAIPFSGTLNGPANPMVAYFQHGPGLPLAADGSDAPEVQFGPPDTIFYGVVVVEGNAETKNKSEFCTGGAAPSPPVAASPCPLGYSAASPPAKAYGYPLAILAYDPKLPFPTILPSYAPQPILADFGTPNTTINGIVYSGGKVVFNPINVNGSVVAFDIDLQATSATYTYVPTYGQDAPPPGFPTSNNVVVLDLQSFITCANYSDESGGPSTCN